MSIVTHKNKRDILAILALATVLNVPTISFAGTTAATNQTISTGAFIVRPPIVAPTTTSGVPVATKPNASVNTTTGMPIATNPKNMPVATQPMPTNTNIPVVINTGTRPILLPPISSSIPTKSYIPNQQKQPKTKWRYFSSRYRQYCASSAVDCNVQIRYYDSINHKLMFKRSRQY